MNQNEAALNMKVDVRLRTRILKSTKKNLGAFVTAVVLFLLMSLLSDKFLTAVNLTNLMKQVVTNGFLGIALTLALIAGLIDLSVSSSVAFHGVLMVLLLRSGVSFPLALLIVIGCALLVGVINGALLALTRIPPFIATLAMQQVLRGGAYILTDGKSIRCENDAFFFLSNGSVGPIPFQTLFLLLVALVIGIMLSRTKFGRHIYAVGGNIESARYSGINIKKVVWITMVIVSLISGIAGIFQASRIYSGQPSAAVGIEGDAVAAAVLGGVAFSGGKGNVVGTLLGCIVITIIANGMNLLGISSYYQQVIKGLIILVAVFMDTLRKY